MLDRLQSFHALPNWDIPSYSLSYSQVIPKTTGIFYHCPTSASNAPFEESRDSLNGNDKIHANPH